MSRIIKTIEIEGKPAKALFDTGPFHTYVLREFLEGVPTLPVTKPYEVALGGEGEREESCTRAAANDHDVESGPTTFHAAPERGQFELTLADSDEHDRRRVQTLDAFCLEPDLERVHPGQSARQ